MTLFDAEAGARLREDGIQRAAEAAPPTFMATALDVVKRLAEDQPDLATDEIWEALHQMDADLAPEPRALGGVMRQAKAAGWIIRTSRTRPSQLPQQHRRPLAIWRSLLYPERQP